MFKERRKRFLINKPLQFRYMAYTGGMLLFVGSMVIVSLYFGIWGGILESFSDDQIRERLVTASRLAEYEAARLPASADKSHSLLSLFKQSEKLSHRQREVFKDILDETNKKLIVKLIFLLLLIAWGSVYLTHKIAGPLYRIHASLKSVNEGDLKTRIHFRQGDEARFIAEEFNSAIEKIDSSISRMKEVVETHEGQPDQIQKCLKEELVRFKTRADK